MNSDIWTVPLVLTVAEFSKTLTTVLLPSVEFNVKVPELIFVIEDLISESIRVIVEAFLIEFATWAFPSLTNTFFKVALPIIFSKTLLLSSNTTFSAYNIAFLLFNTITSSPANIVKLYKSNSETLFK